MEKAKTDIRKVIVYYVVILICALVIAFVAQYIFTGTNLFVGLGILPWKECSGSLSISNSGCMFKAKISVTGCAGKTYEVKEDSCFGSLKCDGSADYDSIQATCAWRDSSGNHKYVLCVGNELKDSVSKTC